MPMGNLNILPTIGLNQLAFGLLAAEARQILGKPSEINKFDQYEVWEYPDIGISLFFDLESDKLKQIEVEEVPAFVWDVQLMGESPGYVLEVIKKNTDCKIEITKEPPPVIFYNVEGLGLDFYFEDNKLFTVTARPVE
jgi:hypothetical protein